MYTTQMKDFQTKPIECKLSCNIYLDLRAARQKQKQKYRELFETQKSGNKTNSREICLNITTFASPKVGQDQVSGGVSVPFRHATPVAYALWKPIFGEMSDSVKC